MNINSASAHYRVSDNSANRDPRVSTMRDHQPGQGQEVDKRNGTQMSIGGANASTQSSGVSFNSGRDDNHRNSTSQTSTNPSRSSGSSSEEMIGSFMTAMTDMLMQLLSSLTTGSQQQSTDQQAPMGHDQSPANTGHVPPPANTGYTQQPTDTGYAQPPVGLGSAVITEETKSAADNIILENFEAFDLDANGGISGGELESIMSGLNGESDQMRVAAAVALEGSGGLEEITKSGLLANFGMDTAMANNIMAENFSAFDLGGDGGITAEDLQAVIDDPEIDNVFRGAATVALERLEENGWNDYTEAELLNGLGMDAATSKSILLSEFDTFDKDGDGGITAGDLQATIDDPEADNLLKAAATVGLNELETNGWNDFKEIELLNGFGMDATASNSIMVSNFDAFDKDADGGITAEDLQTVIDDPESSGELKAAATVALDRLETNGWNNYTEVELLNGLGMDAQVSNSILFENFDAFDQSGNGKISANDLQAVIDNPESSGELQAAAKVALDRLETNGWQNFTRSELAGGLGYGFTDANQVMLDNFSEFDKDGDGGITGKDLNNVLDDPNSSGEMKNAAAVALDRLKENDWTNYNVSELENSTKAAKESDAKMMMLNNFSAFDTDGDASVTAKDLKAVISDKNADPTLKEAAKVSLALMQEKGWGDYKQSELFEGVGITNEVIRASMQQNFDALNTDGAGGVTAADLEAVINDPKADEKMKLIASAALAQMTENGWDDYTLAEVTPEA